MPTEANDAAREFAELFPRVYLAFHRRDEKRELPNASRAVLQHLALTGPLTIGEMAQHLERAQSVVSEIVDHLERDGLLEQTASVKAELYGSLGATGKGHGTDRGVMLGLMGEAPDTVDPSTIAAQLEVVQKSRRLALLGKHDIAFTANVSHRYSPCSCRSNALF